MRICGNFGSPERTGSKVLPPPAPFGHKCYPPPPAPFGHKCYPPWLPLGISAMHPPPASGNPVVSPTGPCSGEGLLSLSWPLHNRRPLRLESLQQKWNHQKRDIKNWTLRGSKQNQLLLHHLNITNQTTFTFGVGKLDSYYQYVGLRLGDNDTWCLWSCDALWRTLHLQY